MNAKTVVDVHMQRNVRKQIRIEPFGSISSRQNVHLFENSL